MKKFLNSPVITHEIMVGAKLMAEACQKEDGLPQNQQELAMALYSMARATIGMLFIDGHLALTLDESRRVGEVSPVWQGTLGADADASD